jgi:hypothetical protein
MKRIWLSFLSWLLNEAKKKVEVDPSVKPGACGCDLTSPLCDPDTSKYNGVTMDWDNPAQKAFIHHQECAIEPATGLMVRYCVWVPSRNCWWMLSDIGIGHVRRVGNDLVSDCFTYGSWRIHVRGYSRADITSSRNPTPPPDVVGNKSPYTGNRQYILVDCRKAS